MQRARLWIAIFCSAIAAPIGAEERTERFDQDPGWDSLNNRPTEPPRKVVQDFGFSKTSHAGGQPGELGGFIYAAAEPAYFAKKIARKTFGDVLAASGSLACTGEPFHVLVGFFNADTLNEWRTPNSIALRLSGRGDVFYAWVEYATCRWRAGGDSPRSFAMVTNPETGRQEPKGFPAAGRVYKWSLRYDPNGNNGAGSITATIGDQTAVCNLDEGHKADGATFNRFGLLTVMKSADSGGRLWLDDLTINDESERFDTDLGWQGFQNRRTYTSANVRPRFDFGFSATHHAAGRAPGELGGLIFRGDCRYPNTLGYYGDRIGPLTLEMPLRVSGKVCMRRGVTDSTALIGFFHSKDSVRVNPSQSAGLPKSFLGVSIDGPSREGFYFAPAYRTKDGESGYGDRRTPPYIYPDGKPRNWSLEFTPGSGSTDGRITVTLDGQSVPLEVKADHIRSATQFDRFGIVTTWIDGNSQTLYFDDLTYTCR
jgi:hypothetical protein